MPTVTYYVPNLSCKHCVMRVEQTLGQLDGVLDVRADLTSKTVVVTYQAPMTDEQLRQALADIHYPVAKRLA